MRKTRRADVKKLCEIREKGGGRAGTMRDSLCKEILVEDFSGETEKEIFSRKGSFMLVTTLLVT